MVARYCKLANIILGFVKKKSLHRNTEFICSEIQIILKRKKPHVDYEKAAEITLANKWWLVWISVTCSGYINNVPLRLWQSTYSMYLALIAPSKKISLPKNFASQTDFGCKGCREGNSSLVFHPWTELFDRGIWVFKWAAKQSGRRRQNLASTLQCKVLSQMENIKN